MIGDNLYQSIKFRYCLPCTLISLESISFYFGGGGGMGLATLKAETVLFLTVIHILAIMIFCFNYSL